MRITEHFDSAEWEGSDGPYPLERIDAEDAEGRTWRETRLQPLAETLEAIRRCIDGPLAITPHGGYRSEEHQQRLVDESPDAAQAGEIAGATTSQHPKGRAADVYSRKWAANQLHAIILDMWRRGELPHLGGLGLYPTFVHVDVRPRPASGHLAQWGGSRAANVA